MEEGLNCVMVSIVNTNKSMNDPTATRNIRASAAEKHLQNDSISLIPRDHTSSSMRAKVWSGDKCGSAVSEFWTVNQNTRHEAVQSIVMVS